MQIMKERSNLPLGIAAFLIIAIALKLSNSQIKPSNDWFGSITLSISIISVLLGLLLLFLFLWEIPACPTKSVVFKNNIKN